MLTVKKDTAILGLVFLLLVILFVMLFHPAYESETGIKFYSDSKVYEFFYDNFDISNYYQLVEVTKNFLGPTFLLWLTQKELWLIFVLNFIFFVVSYRVMSKHISYEKRSCFLLLLIINPFVFFSIFSVNKEIILLLTISLFLDYLISGNRKVLFWVFILSILVRWQMALFVISFLFLSFLLKGRTSFFRFLVFVLYVTGISFLYGVMGELTSSLHIRNESNLSAGEVSFFVKLSDFQQAGYYLIVFPAKFAHLYFGMLLNGFPSEGLDLFYNYYVRYFSSLYNLLLLVFLFGLNFFKRLKVDPLVFNLALFLAVFFSLTPIYEPRYLLPVSITLLFSIFYKKTI